MARSKGLSPLVVLFLLTLGSPAWAQDFWAWVGGVRAGDAEGRATLSTVIQRYKENDPTAGAVLGYLYLTGVVYPRDLEKAWEFFAWAGGRGSAWGMTWMGFMLGGRYRQMASLEEAHRQGARLLREAMSKGNLSAQAFYGAFLILGYDPEAPRDPSRGLKLIQEAAGRGDPIGKRQLGRVYLGLEPPFRLLEPDPAKARALFEEASAKDYTSWGYLAYMLYRGLGGPKDPGRAVALAKPLVGFDPYATGVYLLALYDGKGTAQNRAEACRLAASPAGGIIPGYQAYIRALCLKEAGQKVEAYAHLLEAVGRNVPEALPLLKEWEKGMTKEELERAKARFKSLP